MTAAATIADASPGASIDGDAAVLCVGASFRTAPIALRERLALSPAAASAVLARFGCGRSEKPVGLSELVVLSTCNRVELYAAGGVNAWPFLVELLAESTGVRIGELAPALYHLAGTEAVRHLSRTAAGLDSMVIGEPQILGQVSEAYATALAHGAAGHALGVLFRGAIKAGRRARAETAINRNPATVSSAAVKLVGESLGELLGKSVVVVGAGEMAELALAALHYRGVRDVCVVSRTREHAEQLSSRFGGRTEPFERLQAALDTADIVVTSTSAPHHVITTDMVAAALLRRPDRRLAIIDIAVPRDVEPGVAALPSVDYFDLDDLQRHVTESLEEREMEIPRVEEIVAEEAAACAAALQQLDVQPLIADLRAHTDEVRRMALDRAQRQFSHLPEGDRKRIEAFSESLVNRLFHEPMVRLRAESRNGQVAGYAMAIRHLFGLQR